MESTVGIHVSSDIARLQKVLVHEPGPEWDLIPCGPGVLERYLTEDIFVLSRAQEEHHVLTDVLGQFIGAQNVFEFARLLEEVLAQPANKTELIGAVTALESLGCGAAQALRDLPDKELAKALLHGAIIGNPDSGPSSYKNIFPSIPNLLFTRDLGAAIPGGFVICHAAKPARRRETLLMRFVLRYDLFKNTNILDVRDFSGKIFWADIDGGEPVSIEGGDIVILNENTLMVGTGERTTEGAFILLLDLLEKFKSPIRTVIRALIPKERASMHLDTVFTVLNENETMAYRPVIDDYEYQVYPAPYTVDPPKTTFIKAMKAAGLAHLKCLSCGGENRLLQSREQWTDGANLFAIAPGVLIGYDRNLVTAGVLENNKYRYLQATKKKDMREIGKIAADFKAGNAVPPVMIGIPGAELSRARGGARCMTMPLARADLLPSRSEKRALGDDGF